MANLNIMGNGFDLYHGLPTSYYFFACYLLTSDEELYDVIANMYGYTKGIVNGHTKDIDRRIDNIFWSEFENRLAYLSPDWVEGSLVDDLGLECSDAVELEVEHDYEQSFRNRKTEYQFEKEILEELRKPVGNCLASMAVYLKDIAEPEYICLYGLSLGDVDLPYLQHIRERWKNAKWRFSYHSDEPMCEEKV